MSSENSSGETSVDAGAPPPPAGDNAPAPSPSPELASAAEPSPPPAAEPINGDLPAEELPSPAPVDESVDDASPEIADPEPMQVPPGRPASVNAVLIPLTLIDDDVTFRIRDDSDVAGLATSIARVGQYVPLEVRPHAGRMQVIAGFRRLAAVRLLHREQVLVRIHEGMSDADALVLALAHGLEQHAVAPDEIEALRERLHAAERLTPQAKGLIEAALVTPGSDLEPESGGAEDEVDLDELVKDLEQRLAGISADLAAVTDLWDQMDDAPRSALLEQLRYYAELHAFYARRR